MFDLSVHAFAEFMMRRVLGWDIIKSRDITFIISEVEIEWHMTFEN